MALAPEWMSYTKDVSNSQGSRFLGRERERERGPPKYGRQLSHNNLSYVSAPPQPYSFSSSDPYDRKVPSTPFACSLSSPPAPPHAPPSILGEPPSRVLNRSKSSPGFGSPKTPNNKPKKSPERNFPTYNKPPKPKPTKPPINPAYYSKSISQPNLFNNEKPANWKTQPSTLTPSPLATSHTPAPSVVTSYVTSPPQPPPPSISPPLPPSSSPPPVLVPEIDKLKQLIPNTGMPPKSVRPRGVVGPPLPLTKKPPPSISSVSHAPPPGLQPSPSTSSVPGAPPALAAYFRKATSEPSLMHHKTQGVDAAQVSARRDAASKKARAMESEKAQIQLLREAVAAKQPKRSNFFQHLIKKEEQGEPLLEDDTPIGADQAATPTNTSEPDSPPFSPPPSSPPPAGLRSPLPEDMEDEERFLRTLGWVPDEEDPVPVLAEEEIADVRVKIILSKAQRGQHDSVPLSIDVGVK